MHTIIVKKDAQKQTKKILCIPESCGGYSILTHTHKIIMNMYYDAWMNKGWILDTHGYEHSLQDYDVHLQNKILFRNSY